MNDHSRILIPGYGYSPAFYEEIRIYYESHQDQTPREIAAHFSIAYQTVRKIIDPDYKKFMKKQTMDYQKSQKEREREKYNTSKLVVLESPFAGDRDRNITYARRALRDSLFRGESPFMSHLLYTQVLDDFDRSERELGINAGLAWRKAANYWVVYDDYGISTGMTLGIDSAARHGLVVEYRKIGPNP